MAHAGARVELEMFADKPRTIHLYEKMGFALEGCRRMAVVKNGRYVDEYVMSRIRRPGETAPAR